jgi:hypothetical protein
MPGPFRWFFVAFLSVFVLAALVPFKLGLFILAGRTRLTVGKDRLTITQIAGPVRWFRRVRFTDIERFEITTRLTPTDGRPAHPLAHPGALVAILPNRKKSALVLVGYPGDWLEAIAGELAGLIKLHGGNVTVGKVEKSLGDDAAPSAAEPEEDEEEDTAQLLDKPPGSLATLTETASGFEATLPSRGLLKDSAGLIQVGIFWCLILGVITGLVLSGAHGGTAHGFLTLIGSKLEPFLFILGFWAIGIVVLLGGIHLGTRRWSIEADQQRLRVTVRSALRSREWTWAASEIHNIQAGDSNVSVNDRPLAELQVSSSSGKKTGLLRGRDRDELDWLAARLRRALQVCNSDRKDLRGR